MVQLDNNIIKLPDKRENFFDLYFKYSGLSSKKTTEIPTIFNRWCPVSMVGTILAKQCWLEHGHTIHYPNLYVILVGEPATRKSTALNLVKKILKRMGYNRFAADRTSKERFLMDLKPFNEEDEQRDIEELIDLKINEPAHRLILTGELIEFTGKHNLEFLIMLGNLYDNLDEYDHPKLNGSSIHVDNPNVHLLAGCQPDMMHSVFPTEAMGQGIMSRLILVFSPATGIKISFPEPPKEVDIKNVVDRLKEIQRTMHGPMTLSKSAKLVLDQMYNEEVGVDDFRFKHYNNRRFVQLLKVSMIFAAMDCRHLVSVDDAIQANTLLFATETRMPRALGEFGMSRDSEIVNKIIQILSHYNQPVGARRLYKELANDVDNYNKLVDILQGMQQAEKIKSIHIGGNQGYVPNVGKRETWKEELIDMDFLTAEEIG